MKLYQRLKGSASTAISRLELTLYTSLI